MRRRCAIAVHGERSQPESGARASPPEGQFSGAVSVEQWWSDVIAVSRGSKVLEVTLSWTGAPGDLDLHLMSPSGRHYAAYADTTGYSGDTNPKTFRVPNPEPGLWRISVKGCAGSGANQFRRGDVRDPQSKADAARVALAFHQIFRPAGSSMAAMPTV